MIKPSKKNYKSVVNKIRKIIKENPTVKQEDLIHKLNPVIRGWVNYQKYNVSSKSFGRLDFDIWRALWKWCCRRHKRKGKRWIAAKYFHYIGSRAWTFSVKPDSYDDYLRLVYAATQTFADSIKSKQKQIHSMRNGRNTLHKERNALCVII